MIRVTPVVCCSRLGAFAEERFQAALDRFGLGRFLAAELGKAR